MPRDVFAFEDGFYLMCVTSRVWGDVQAFGDPGYVGRSPRACFDLDWFVPRFVFELVDDTW